MLRSPVAATSVERAITSSLELISKLLGMIIHRHDVRSTSILVSSDYLRLRQVITTALRAARDVAGPTGLVCEFSPT